MTFILLIKPDELDTCEVDGNQNVSQVYINTFRIESQVRSIPMKAILMNMWTYTLKLTPYVPYQLGKGPFGTY